MGYTRGNGVLPPELPAEVQKYVNGAYLYIPRREDCRKSWGETTRSREATSARNRCLDEQYRQGAGAQELAHRYCLSVKTIHKITAAVKRGR